jgi:hypothetical protein
LEVVGVRMPSSKTLEGVITTWNKGAERIFGCSRDE